jgi:hypothetical protein
VSVRARAPVPLYICYMRFFRVIIGQVILSTSLWLFERKEKKFMKKNRSSHISEAGIEFNKKTVLNIAVINEIFQLIVFICKTIYLLCNISVYTHTHTTYIRDSILQLHIFIFSLYPIYILPIKFSKNNSNCNYISS